MLSPTTMAPSSYLAYFLLGESTRRRSTDRSGISGAFGAFRPGLYSARCLREFGLIIGFRCITPELRLLIVPPGGMMASKPLFIVEEQGKKDTPRVFISMLMLESSIFPSRH